jgi:hypothetical protein
MFDDVHKYHVLRTMLAVTGVCTMTSNNKITTTFVDSVCYDSFGCCSDIVADRSVGVSLPSKAADQVDISTLSNAIAAPTHARDLQRACEPFIFFASDEFWLTEMMLWQKFHATESALLRCVSYNRALILVC